MSRSSVIRAREVHDEGKELYAIGEYENAVTSFRSAVTVLEARGHKHKMETIKSYWRMGRAQWLSHTNNESSNPTRGTTTTTTSPLSSPSSSSSSATTTTSSSKSPDRVGKNKDIMIDAIGSFKRCLRLVEFDGYYEGGSDHVVVTKTLREDIEIFIHKHGLNDYRNDQQLWIAATEALDQERQGDIYTKQHKYDSALSCYRRVIEIERGIFGTVIGRNQSNRRPGTLDYADVTCKIARLERLLGNRGRSLATFNMAYKIYKWSWGEQHPSTIATAANIRSLQ